MRAERIATIVPAPLRLALLAWLVGAGGCESGRGGVVVDVQTDLRPGLELGLLSVELRSGTSTGSAPLAVSPNITPVASETALYARSRRVAEFTDLPPGVYSVRAVGRAVVPPGRPPDSGITLAERTVTFTLDDALRVVRVVLGASCAGTICPTSDDVPSLTECLNGHCVAPQCDPTDPATCAPESLCAAPTDCPISASCARATCVTGVCIEEEIDGACDDGMFCGLAGCEPRPGVSMDAGLDAAAPLDALVAQDAASARDTSREPDAPVSPSIDAGPDAGPDAGMDAGHDAGMDAGRDAGIDAGRDAGMDAGRDAGMDAGRRDAGRDACECVPGAVSSIACGTCGTRARTCGGTCSWGAYGPCSDDDARCTSPDAPSCVNDYCWGWVTTSSAPTSCVDMAVDHDPAPGIWLTLGADVHGRPGATWIEESAQVSCAVPTIVESDPRVIGASGVDRFSRGYGPSDCTSATHGGWEHRLFVTDADGSSFYLPGSDYTRFYNSTCAPERRTCTAALTFCP